jgi:cyclohexanecarboxylate-CoA ligase
MSEHRFDPVAHARSMRASGFWIDKSFDEFLQQAVAATPEKRCWPTAPIVSNRSA